MPLPRPRNSAEQVVLGRQIMPAEKWREILKHETRSEDGHGGPTGTGNLLDLYPEVNPAAHCPCPVRQIWRSLLSGLGPACANLSG